MDAIKAVFARCKDDHRAALITYVTAGYPTANGTPEIMLAMQAGGAGDYFQQAISILQVLTVID